jgi:hypothetical protein
VGQGGLPNTSASTRNLNYSLADVRSMYDDWRWSIEIL